MKKIAVLALAAAMLAACGEGPSTGKHAKKALQLTSRQQEMCNKQNDFSLDMLQEVVEKEKGNVFISPLSASFVCAMLANGAVGETQDEILHAMGLGDYTMNEINAHYLNLMECLPYQDETTTLHIANALWVDDGYPVEESFLNTVRDHYLATADNLDLQDGASADVINAWVNKNTKGMIKKICDEDYFVEGLRLVVANAICFVGKWQEEFKKSQTYEQTFHAPKGDVQTDMMHGKFDVMTTGNCLFDYNEWDEEANYYKVKEELHARLLRMDYKGKGYSMEIILPDEDQDFDEWIDNFNIELVEKMEKAGIWGETEVAVPKFKMEKQYRLNEVMQEMGMQKIFDPMNADLSGISTATKLYLALLQQNTFVEVDEEGTKAAAVTTGWANDAACEPSEPFICDRPFVFLIRTNSPGIVLFAGVVRNPKE